MKKRKDGFDCRGNILAFKNVSLSSYTTCRVWPSQTLMDITFQSSERDSQLSSNIKRCLSPQLLSCPFTAIKAVETHNMFFNYPESMLSRLFSGLHRGTWNKQFCLGNLSRAGHIWGFSASSSGSFSPYSNVAEAWEWWHPRAILPGMWFWKQEQDCGLVSAISSGSR